MSQESYHSSSVFDTPRQHLSSIVPIDGGKVKRPSPFLEGLDNPKAQARRARAKAAKVRKLNEHRDKEIYTALAFFDMSERQAAKALGVSRSVVRGVKRRIRPDGKLRMYVAE